MRRVPLYRIDITVVVLFAVTIVCFSCNTVIINFSFSVIIMAAHAPHEAVVPLPRFIGPFERTVWRMPHLILNPDLRFRKAFCTRADWVPQPLFLRSLLRHLRFPLHFIEVVYEFLSFYRHPQLVQQSDWRRERNRLGYDW